MSDAYKVSCLRKYWYVVLILILLLVVLIGMIINSGKQPEELLRDYGYWVILGWTFLEGETIVIIAGLLSAKVGLSPPLIALAAFCGSFASDQIMFSLGRYKGESVLRFFPRIARNVDKAARLFKKYDVMLILGFRFVYGVRNVTPILLGISKVSHKKFFVLNAIGAAVWALTFTYGGLYAGKAFMAVMHQFGHGVLYFLLVILALAGILWYVRARINIKKACEVTKRCRDEADLDLPQTPACKAAGEGVEEYIAFAAEEERKAREAAAEQETAAQQAATQETTQTEEEGRTGTPGDSARSAGKGNTE